MTPLTSEMIEYTGVLNEEDAESLVGELSSNDQLLIRTEKREYHLLWSNTIFLTLFHIFAVYGFWLTLTAAKYYTVLFAYLLSWISSFGVTAGAHRLWAHRSFKAKLPLRILLAALNTVAFQYCIIWWARDHRIHHKYSETDADPYNALRGFFFAQIGWLLCKKHPEVIRKGKNLNASDLLADPVLIFQKKYYIILMPIACFILPTTIPMYFWNESFSNSFFVAAVLRWIYCLHVTGLVNSVGHMWGNRPYDSTINPSQSLIVSILTFGEGWHNYHHVFPWDYKSDELGSSYINQTKVFIDCFAKIGWAYDLKSVSTEIVKKRVERTGDGSYST